MSIEPNQDDRRNNEQDPPEKDYFGRILIGLVILAAVLWTLSFIF